MLTDAFYGYEITEKGPWRDLKGVDGKNS